MPSTYCLCSRELNSSSAKLLEECIENCDWVSTSKHSKKEK